MLQYAIRRVLWTIPVILVCTTLLFGLMHAGGGNFLRHPPPAGLCLPAAAARIAPVNSTGFNSRTQKS